MMYWLPVVMAATLLAAVFCAGYVAGLRTWLKRPPEPPAVHVPILPVSGYSLDELLQSCAPARARPYLIGTVPAAPFIEHDDIDFKMEVTVFPNEPDDDCDGLEAN